MKLINTLHTLLAVTLLTVSATAVAQSHLPGEFIVMFHNDQDVAKWAAECGLEHVDVLSPRAHIHLFRVQSETTSAQDWAVLRSLRDDDRLEAAQFNHTVQNRETLPNDPQLGQQWHHVENGDHDIDSDLAWDITTGGAAADGSRIVVAVLEGGGSNYNHVDLIDNHWVNEAEIPGNGVDDDENGFVDDYNGWNSGGNNDAIAAGGHGTSVSGMIGAVGDNGVGGVGVNWDVDIMQVDMGGGLTESNVIAAYNYPYEMRAIFNESDGARGAFVVATNASWGIDLANPANYPVWCAYYDDLGEQGILNCGATANAQYNIDTQGDMPTGCSSPYMVSVTATDDNDVRTFSAYGATTIDLGAPGDAVFLPSGTSGYGNTSGTSFASPCVAGAIALVYSAPCPDLMGLALSNPQAAADLVLGYILDGTDEVNNLIGETVTGGRLNVYNALELALANCGPIECSTDSIYASSSCVYDASLGEAVTEIQLGVELGSFLCSTTTVCQSNDLDSLGTMCDSLMIASGETYTFSGMYPSASYAFYVTVDSLVSDTIMVSTPACDTLVPGCTTAVDAFGNEALNFDPLATIDDGSCEFPCVDFSLTILTDCWPEEVGWELVLGDTVVASVDAGGYSEAETEVSFEQCLTQGCYTFVLTDEYGDGLNGAAWNQCGVDGNYTATDSSGTVLFAMGEADYGDEIQHEFCLPAVFGCTNPDACNFDALANTDNGLCEVPGDPCDDGVENTVFDEIGDDCMCTGVPAVFGCTDEDACNYNELANVDDESCYTLGEGSISGPLFPFAGGESTYTYNGAIGDSFIWTVVGGEITEGQGTSQINVIWGSEPGGASVTVLEADSTGCEGEVVRTVQILAVDNVIGLDNVHLELVPNPARGRVFFDWGVSDIQQANVVLYDVLGANVLQATTSAWLDLEGIAPGRYTVVATTSQGRVTLPLMVQ
ncbi:MAG: S8 family serine peptidase [Bacteroidota bacterium]|nr:S8 family serine peptidase [Bacteroidota bacterium]